MAERDPGTGKMDGKVVLITGGARGQGRSHAITFAREGAEIIVCDVAEQLPSAPYPLASNEELAETARMVPRPQSALPGGSG